MSSISSAEPPFLQPMGKQNFPSPPRILIIGAGSRGNAYAEAVLLASNAVIATVCEPNEYKRTAFVNKFIVHTSDGENKKKEHDSFTGWKEWREYEVQRRERERAGLATEKGVDTVFVCVLDEMHEEVVCGIAGLGLHMCCEKPMSTRLESCVRMYKALKDASLGRVNSGSGAKEAVFGIGHVLRYSPHNMMLRHLLLEKDVIGDVMSIEHVEPIGWWHFAHSYVRGNWRQESKTAPSLLTKSCHDIDFLMWMLCSPAPNTVNATPHLPSFVTSAGSLKFFRKERKPKAAGSATNCLSCKHEPDCTYSAKKIYLERHLDTGNAHWPVNIVVPEIEDIYKTVGRDEAAKKLLENLSEDYMAETPVGQVEERPWFGRCVWESNNDVCDDQCVTITWDDDPIANDEDGQAILSGRGAKTAQFHMVAFTEKQCERRGRIYGTRGEIEYDSADIKVHDFATGQTKIYSPHMAGGHHGGGDEGLARQFIMAVNAVNSGAMSAPDAQRAYLGCDLEETFRSHAMVFAAEEARTKRQVVDWKTWWHETVESQLHQR
ncbi:dehydrogenases and related s [Pyrenophora seminiperda CCB06]|uniref:Dehydrogenases and related s n=1 Tax=Pyrenophora seminiperda CCB06 TaxID=1302712 RepID=A0A3M7MAZ2_9PLEO|nr:dehydrogenases and related s [Pyrenophora seminiperda CCB06]